MPTKNSTKLECSVIVYKQDDVVKFCTRKPIGKMKTETGVVVLCTKHKKRLEGGHTLLVVDSKNQIYMVGLPAKKSPKQK